MDMVVMPCSAAALEAKICTLRPKAFAEMRFQKHTAYTPVLCQPRQRAAHARAIKRIFWEQGLKPVQIPTERWKGMKAGCRPGFESEIAQRRAGQAGLVAGPVVIPEGEVQLGTVLVAEV